MCVALATGSGLAAHGRFRSWLRIARIDLWQSRFAPRAALYCAPALLWALVVQSIVFVVDGSQGRVEASRILPKGQSQTILGTMSGRDIEDIVILSPTLADHDAGTVREGHITHLKFDGYTIRRIIHTGEPFYSVVDAVGALTDSKSARNSSDYWAQTKRRMIEEEDAEQLLTKCQQLKLPSADGKSYRTDCANIETLFRIIQSIPSKKAEPFKQWLAKVGFERIRESAQPSLAARRMVQAYRALGYSDDWTDERLQEAVADAHWDEELGNRGVKEKSKANVRAAVHEEAFGLTLRQHRTAKRASNNDDIPDRMNNIELLIDRLAKAAGTEIMRARDTRAHEKTRQAALDGASIAGTARKGIEEQTKRSIITKGRELPKLTDGK